MNATLSLYLHLVRFGAAFAVVASHLWPIVEPSQPLPWPGHEAVVVFFVLSGIVITYATDQREDNATDYALHRLARLWSVLVPALVLGAAVSQIGHIEELNGNAPVMTGLSETTWRSFANLTFIAQIGNLDLPPALNAPFWSLNYEAWYYVIFGVWLYTRGWLRIVLLPLACIIAGPRILLLLPVWLMGVAVYRLRSTFSERVALGLFLGTIALALAYFHFGVSIQIRSWMIARWPELMASLRASNQFVGDIGLGVIVSLNFAAAASLGRYARPLFLLERPIRIAASYTLSAYLYHMPIFVLFWSGFGIRSRLVYLAVAVLIVMLGRVTEHQIKPARAFLLQMWSARRGFVLQGIETGALRAGKL